MSVAKPRKASVSAAKRSARSAKRKRQQLKAKPALALRQKTPPSKAVHRLKKLKKLRKYLLLKKRQNQRRN